MTASAGEHDPGAAHERTSLAWRRTSLAFAVNGILLLRTTDVWMQVGAASVLAVAAFIAAMSARTFAEKPMRGVFADRSRRIGLLVLLTSVVCVLDVISILRRG